jgi:hypothetical protein
MDIAYLRHWSIFTDLEILLRTFSFVVRGRGSVPAIDRGDREPPRRKGSPTPAPAPGGSIA